MVKLPLTKGRQSRHQNYAAHRRVVDEATVRYDASGYSMAKINNYPQQSFHNALIDQFPSRSSSKVFEHYDTTTDLEGQRSSR